MNLKPGVRLVSQVCSTQVVVVKAPADPVDLRCGGQSLALADQVSDLGEPLEGFAAGTSMGKRYGDDSVGLQVLCTKPGIGSLSIGDVLLALAEARALPSSD